MTTQTTRAFLSAVAAKRKPLFFRRFCAPSASQALLNLFPPIIARKMNGRRRHATAIVYDRGESENKIPFHANFLGELRK
jgi:hypothetical protein